MKPARNRTDGRREAGQPVEVRRATAEDWPELLRSFSQQYRLGHPLLDREHWDWRFGDPAHGASLVACAGGSIVGHVGAAIETDVTWIINVFLQPEVRGRGVLRRLYALAAELGPLAATNVNEAGSAMYRKMGWHRQPDLERWVIWDRRPDPQRILDRVAEPPPWPRAGGSHYWRQPGLLGLVAPDGSAVVDQRDVGGLRAIDLVDPVALPGLAFDAGVRWLDYVTSANDPLRVRLAAAGWSPDAAGPVPWLLAPVVPTSRAHINVFTAARSLAPGRIIRRSESDHGRVGSSPLRGT